MRNSQPTQQQTSQNQVYCKVRKYIEHISILQQIENFENASNNHLSDLIKYPQDPLVTAIIMPASD